MDNKEDFHRRFDSFGPAQNDVACGATLGFVRFGRQYHPTNYIPQMRLNVAAWFPAKPAAAEKPDWRIVGGQDY
jgi:hypothetical protein